MTMNRRRLLQEMDDLRHELSQALARAEAAEQELRDLRQAVEIAYKLRMSLDDAPRPLPALTDLSWVPAPAGPHVYAPPHHLPAEVPATPVAEESADG